jgi:hypothetical protein
MQSDPEIDLTAKNAGARHSAEQRRAIRQLNLPAKMNIVIKGKDSNFRSWSEPAELESLSGSGAGFVVSEQCPVGTLVSLMMPMPKHLRKYDADKRLYRVWGLVQYCYRAAGEDAAGFHVGVAFIGKDAPPSYSRDPMRSYRVCGMHKNGLWKVEELENSFRERSAVRYWNSIEATIHKLDEEQHAVASESTVTENISESGALVYSDLRVSVGERIRFQSASPSFSSIAIVGCRRIGQDNRTRIHLEFVENKFPIVNIQDPIEEAGEH